MRGHGNHETPESTQGAPEDNTTAYVMRQVRVWVTLGDKGLIHEESAREIAAWWQAPGNAFSAFSHTGTIEQGFADEIAEYIERGGADESVPYTEWAQQHNALRALDAYVRASRVTVWTVGKNMAGYLPETDVRSYVDYADAVTAYRDMLHDEAPDDVARTDECTCGQEADNGGESCELCTVEALIGGYIRDEVPYVAGTRVFGEPRTLGLTINAESWAGSMAYFLAREDNVRYGEWLSERDA